MTDTRTGSDTDAGGSITCWHPPRTNPGSKSNKSSASSPGPVLFRERIASCPVFAGKRRGRDGKQGKGAFEIMDNQPWTNAARLRKVAAVIHAIKEVRE